MNQIEDNREDKNKEQDMHTPRHSYSVNTPSVCVSFSFFPLGSFYWTDNRINEHMCDLIISLAAGKEAVMLPTRCRPSHSELVTHTETHMHTLKKSFQQT